MGVELGTLTPQVIRSCIHRKSAEKTLPQHIARYPLHQNVTVGNPFYLTGHKSTDTDATNQQYADAVHQLVSSMLRFNKTGEGDVPIPSNIIPEFDCTVDELTQWLKDA